MIETTVGHIRGQQYQQGWAKILQYPFGGETKYRVLKMEKAIQAELKPALEVLETVAKTLGEMDAQKNYKIKDENIKQWSDEVAKVNEILLKVDRPKLPMKELDKVNLSALDLLSLDFMLCDIELVPDEVVEKPNH